MYLQKDEEARPWGRKRPPPVWAAGAARA